jgi:7-keto-8-aminopelargonate synthetase-like enzyme
MDIVFSEEGNARRQQLMANIERLRMGMHQRDVKVGGTPSPIVPVFVGEEKVARLTSKLIVEAGLMANLVEFPAVARGKARFRFQMMSTHQDVAIDRACEILAQAKLKAEHYWRQ